MSVKHLSFKTPGPGRRLVALLLATLLLGPVAAVRADQAGDDLKFAQGLFQSQRYSLAEEAFRKFVAAHPGHDQISLGLLYLGLSQFQNAKYAEARKTLSDFVKRFDKSKDVPHASYRVAECTYYLGEMEPAAAAFEKCLKQYPEDPLREFAWAWMGDAQRRLGRHPDAIATLQKSIDQFPTGRMIIDAKFWQAQSYEATRNVAKATALYREVAAETASDRADAAQLAVANLLFGQQQYPQAVVEYQQLEKRFEKSPLIPVARLNAGYAAYRQGDYRQAMQFFDTAEDEASQAVTAGYWKGLSLKALGDFAGAADVLGQMRDAAKADPLAESILFQLADCRFRADDIPAAEKAFLEVVDRFPKGPSAAQSLYFATECGLKQMAALTGDERTHRMKSVELLLDRFDRDFSTSDIRLSHDLQRAEFLTERGAGGDEDRAAALYKGVINGSQVDRTRNEARYELARLQQRQQKPADAFATIRPLADEVLNNPDRGFPEALVLHSVLAVEVNQPGDAVRSATAYLKLGGPLADQALAQLAIGSARTGQWPAATKAIERLAAEHDTSPQLPRALQIVADTAYEAEQWNEAIRCFTALSMTGADSPWHPAALSGLGWSLFQKGDYGPAEQRFRELLDRHPQHELAPIAAFKVGECLQKADRLADAAKAFDTAFTKYKPARQSFLAGLQAARMRVKNMQIDEADRTYAAISEAYPDLPEHPLLLNEWARVLAEHEQFEKSDAVFRTLITRHPGSPFVDNARFFLAESDLVSGKLDPARAAFEQLAADTKADTEVREDSLFRLVSLAVEAQQWEEVSRRTATLAEQFPNSAHLPESRFHQGHAELRQKRFATAEKILSELLALSKNPEVSGTEWFPHTFALLAEARFQLKNYDGVRQTAAAARQWQANSPLLYLVDEVVGRALKQEARFDEARQALQRVIDAPSGQRTETAAKAQLLIAETWFQQKKYPEAREAYLRVHLLYSFPEWQAPALFQAGKCAELLNQKEDAKKDYQSVIDTFQGSDFATQAADRLKAL